MTAEKTYLHWSEAGGPNECEHGYAEGIPCPHCDKNPKLVALRKALHGVIFDLHNCEYGGDMPRCIHIDDALKLARAAIVHD